MKLALVQMNIEWESKDSNYIIAEKYIRKASNENCDIVVLPEMFNTGFSMNISAVAEDEDGKTASVLSHLAKQNNINLIAGYAVHSSEEGKGKNIAVVYNRKGTLISSFAKLHPFSFVNEDQYYLAGNNPVIFNIEGIPASIFICYDLRFPEVFRCVAKDVQAIFVIANWPASRREHWETLLKARAIENQCYIIAVNRTGVDGNGISYPGASHIFDPTGKKICSGGDSQEFLSCEFDPNEVVNVRSKFPFLKDMRLYNFS